MLNGCGILNFGAVKSWRTLKHLEHRGVQAALLLFAGVKGAINTMNG
jgi:hypothetical protein